MANLRILPATAPAPFGGDDATDGGSGGVGRREGSVHSLIVCGSELVQWWLVHQRRTAVILQFRPATASAPFDGGDGISAATAADESEKEASWSRS